MMEATRREKEQAARKIKAGATKKDDGKQRGTIEG